MALRGSSSWTAGENKRFEDALAMYSEDTPDRFFKIARAVGSKTVEEVMRHYKVLEKDIYKIETDQIPLPNYGVFTINSRGQRVIRNPKPQ